MLSVLASFRQPFPQQGVMCSGRRGGDEDNDGDGKGNENAKALLRIAKGIFLGVSKTQS